MFSYRTLFYLPNPVRWFKTPSYKYAQSLMRVQFLENKDTNARLIRLDLLDGTTRDNPSVFLAFNCVHRQSGNRLSFNSGITRDWKKTPWISG